MAKKKVIFLDRDGAINVDHGYVHTIDDWQWTDKIFEALRLLQEAGFRLVVITNQSGIGQGLYSQQDMQVLHDFMQAELQKQGIQLADIQFCPHTRDGKCDCRKPKTGMAKKAEEKIGPIDYTASWTIGDKIADLQFGKTLGTKTVLIKSTYWTEDTLTEKPDLTVESVYEASLAIRKNN